MRYKFVSVVVYSTLMAISIIGSSYEGIIAAMILMVISAASILSEKQYTEAQVGRFLVGCLAVMQALLVIGGAIVIIVYRLKGGM